MQTPSLQISIENVSKKFASEWIFKNINLNLKQGDKLAILGGNGSGKSTLLQIISGYVLLNSGSVSYSLNKNKLEVEEFKDQLSLATPYFELIEDYSLTELIEHCARFKPFLNNLKTENIIELSGLKDSKNKHIANYSSGMKQRVRLTLAILADAPLLLLDEPVSNLDRAAITWFKDLITTYAQHKTIIVCSNSINEEYDFCTSSINMMDYK